MWDRPLTCCQWWSILGFRSHLLLFLTNWKRIGVVPTVTAQPVHQRTLSRSRERHHVAHGGNPGSCVSSRASSWECPLLGLAPRAMRSTGLWHLWLLSAISSSLLPFDSGSRLVVVPLRLYPAGGLWHHLGAVSCCKALVMKDKFTTLPTFRRAKCHVYSSPMHPKCQWHPVEK